MAVLSVREINRIVEMIENEIIVFLIMKINWCNSWFDINKLPLSTFFIESIHELNGGNTTIIWRGVVFSSEYNMNFMFRARLKKRPDVLSIRIQIKLNKFPGLILIKSSDINIDIFNPIITGNNLVFTLLSWLYKFS